MNKNLILALTFATIAQTAIFFQSQGQFLWTWAKNNPFLMSLLGVPISYLFIKFVKYCSLAFDGQVWPGRLIGFAVGAITFTFLACFILKEPVTTKTSVCLVLSAFILIIQIFWK
jgi:hypothetical protein